MKQALVVIGDAMLDEYVNGLAVKLSAECPVPVVEVCDENITRRLGGAANVAANVRALGGIPHLVSVIGKDTAGTRFGDLLASEGLSDQGVYDMYSRRTTVKTRVSAQGHQIARMDCEERGNIPKDVERSLCTYIDAIAYVAGAIIISDYAKGVVTDKVIQTALNAAASFRVPVFIDPKVANRGRYALIDPLAAEVIMTPNLHEAEGLAGHKIEESGALQHAGEALVMNSGCRHVIITQGEEGMSLFSRTPDGITWTHIPTAAQSVFDVSGAGDTVIAALARFYSQGVPLVDAARLANIAAGVKVGKLGTATVTEHELYDQTKQIHLREILNGLRCASV